MEKGFVFTFEFDPQGDRESMTATYDAIGNIATSLGWSLAYGNMYQAERDNVRAFHTLRTLHGLLSCRLTSLDESERIAAFTETQR